MQNIRLADVLVVAGGVFVVATGEPWMKGAALALVAVWTVVVVRRALRAAESHRWAAADRER